MNKIAVFGSAFNPPTLGHKSVIDSLEHFDQVLLVPSISHAWGKVMADYGTRCQLIEAFISDLSVTNVELSRIEECLFVPGESVTTYAVLNKLQNDFPDSSLTFVVGPDNFVKFSQFYKADEILAKWNVLACPETVAIRSTQVRKQLAESKSIRSLTTASVEQLLGELKIYAS
ncbi:nicotinate-nicotinamide nucleotide adenylyltransferase [Vibrio marisflavi]|uniref:nicotinate-nucleotide adenylyltransferase n=1 Tax=Vibrio marisflavi CECT 7928 TaxID=634439 RepID=A0ABM8ZZA2_9VIBR|nr:nicotinate-nicotinamide nucleotide adenylyltransferase [Vibrio marisflavi]CAH0536341.1 nicotinate-nucleotide adenylyltransferase [Vibrio marisflavi CECT 7928]